MQACIENFAHGVRHPDTICAAGDSKVPIVSSGIIKFR